MWTTLANPARSCRSSMFWVQRKRLPPRATSLLIPGDVGQGFRDELGHRFRFDVGHPSRMNSATV